MAVDEEEGRGKCSISSPFVCPTALFTFTSPLSLSLPDTAFPRINNSARRNTSRKTLFNLDGRERVYITAAGAASLHTLSMKPVLRLPPRNNNSNLLSPSNSRSTLPLLITRTYALPPSVALYTLPSFPLVENRRKISNSQDRRRQCTSEKSGRDCLIASAVVRSISSIPPLPNLPPRLLAPLRGQTNSLCERSGGLSSVSVRMRPRDDGG